MLAAEDFERGLKKNAWVEKKLLTGTGGSYRYPLLPDGENASPGGKQKVHLYVDRADADE
jgi:hypothetical protein